MTKSDVIKRVKDQNFPQDSYVVFGSGPMAVAGIREVNDIDLYVSKELFKELEKKGWKKVQKGPGDNPLTFDVFEAHDNWNFSHFKPTFNELLSRASIVEGVVFASLEDVKKWKSGLERKKDLRDLDLISNYLQKTM
jgi:hypothetical protein